MWIHAISYGRDLKIETNPQQPYIERRLLSSNRDYRKLHESALQVGDFEVLNFHVGDRCPGLEPGSFRI